ncbi:natural cytotoxicity triggering receptor 3 ligand 1-like isoform X2 [Pipistrellus kuhlii]|nr:natural cytotoxicity triggering receptor 3 ligand 1-like isoform X2 [Pipistrellus kuhlii]XP_045439398.1 natural cytotoxicity triggering receptor 3 ligand 1-like isoform X2 [Pipistrellus kuhlii]
MTVLEAASRLLQAFLRLLLLLWCCVSAADFLKVEMEGKNQIVLLNDNVTISCKVPGSTPLDINKSGIIWYLKHQANETEHKVFEMYADIQKAFRLGASVSPAGLEKGDVSLHLPGVQLRDAGEYRCNVVVTPEEAQETVFLKVLGECLRQCPVVPMVMGLGVGMWISEVEHKFGHGPWSWIDMGFKFWASLDVWTT